MSKVVRFENVGDATVLKIVDEKIAEPGPDELRIKVEAIGLNRAEVLFRQGLYLEKPQLPARIGYEASGIVDAVGPNVKGFAIGDKVSTIPAFHMSKYGVYGEHCIVPVSAVAHYPDNLTSIEAASIWMQYLTAYGALVEFGKLKTNDYVLVTAATSSVGYAAMQICHDFGAKFIASTRKKDKKQALLDAGADFVIVTDEEDLVARVKEITNGVGSRLIFDAVAGSMLMTLAKAASYGGIIIEYGALSLEATSFPLMLSLEKMLTVQGYTLFHLSKDPAMFERAKSYVYNGLKTGKLKPVIDKIFNFDQIIESQKYMESNQQKGKIVVQV